MKLRISKRRGLFVRSIFEAVLFDEFVFVEEVEWVGVVEVVVVKEI